MASPAAATTESDGATAGNRRPAAVWIYRPRTDLLISLCWIPLFVVGHRLSGAQGPHSDANLRWAVTAALLVSFLHQPLTLALVYGDRRQFGQRRRLFVLAPPVTIAIVVAAVMMHLWVVVPVAALWNTVHTLQQRYGLSRIYARRAGYGSAALDRWVLYAWMAAAVLLVAANPATLGLVRRVSLDQLNAGGVRMLTGVRPVALALLVPVGLAAVGLAAAIGRQELRAGSSANPARWLYQLSSLLLIASIAIDPAAGFVAYVGGHAIEYGTVVYKTTESRYGRQRDHSTLLGRTARTAAGRVAVLTGVAGAALLLKNRLHGDTANVLLYTIGALHFLYDGFIWKLRKPAVAADFAIQAAA